MAGSSDLTPEQQAWYEERFGVRFLSVQEQPHRQSRRVRRAKAKGGVRHVRAADAPVAQAQHLTVERLRRAPLQARPS